MITILEIKLLSSIVQKSLPYRSVWDQRNDCWLKIIKCVVGEGQGKFSGGRAVQYSIPYPLEPLVQLQSGYQATGTPKAPLALL